MELSWYLKGLGIASLLGILAGTALVLLFSRCGLTGQAIFDGIIMGWVACVGVYLIVATPVLAALHLFKRDR